MADESTQAQAVAPTESVLAQPAPAQPKLNFAKGLIPGDGNPEGSHPDEWKPCGLADGVIYFDNVEIGAAGQRGAEVIKSGKERQALRYLAGPLTQFPVGTAQAQRVAQAQDVILRKRGSLGICEPSIGFLLASNRDIEKEARAAGFPLNRKFLSSDAGIHANQREHRERWHVVKAEEGIWCVFYV